LDHYWSYALKLESILALWEQDSKVDRLELDKESLKIPSLHNKYLKIYSTENLQLKKMVHELKELERNKFEYYSGKLSEEELNDFGWEQFDHKLLKQDIPRYLESDADIINLLLKIDYQKEKVEAVKSIMSNINGRSFNIGNAIKWQQFLNGIN
tara:strand:- start:23 stop:484 length:462 start_codon:yes stop_codon:yes gene_type:complete